MNDDKELSEQLKIAYREYKATKYFLDSPSYGDWTFQMDQTDKESFNAAKKDMDEIMLKLGYTQWTEEEVKNALKKPGKKRSD